MKKKIVFLTGTRADFGKMKPLINKVENSDQFENHVFVTGMHTLSKYGSTYREVEKENYDHIYKYINQANNSKMDIILSNTVLGFSNYINEINPDMIVVHGDRVEALAGAIVGSLNNILVSHVEGGEVSGTIDELIRHSITKLSHLHFVANEEAKKRVVQLGEEETNIYIIGSPDIDVMLSDNLPDIEEAKNRYDIDFENYGIFVYHPVTTELSKLKQNIKEVVNAILESGENYIVIYPNNDEGSEMIFEEYKRLEDKNNFEIFPSIRFEYFLTFLDNCQFIAGNSSSGIREAEIYGIPSINIGSRQNNRSLNKDIINVSESKKEILEAINKAKKLELENKSNFGNGNSSQKFIEILKDKNLWDISYQKNFVDIDNI
ncbi:MAG: UDP-N-acetylglucosamine 2-epimerase [Bacillota bacterium]